MQGDETELQNVSQGEITRTERACPCTEIIENRDNTSKYQRNVFSDPLRAKQQSGVHFFFCFDNSFALTVYTVYHRDRLQTYLICTRHETFFQEKLRQLV